MINLINRSILIIAAHPDDEVLGCGGLLSKICNKSKISIIFIGEGSSCRYKNLNSKEIDNDIKERETASKKVSKKFNLHEIEFFNLPCGRFDQVPIIDINKIIESRISKFNPDIVFTHDPHDVNNDHRIIYRSTIMSTRPNSATNVSNIFTYEVPSSSECSFSEEGQFSPNFFVELSKSDLENKFEALSFYSSEIKPFPFPRSFKGIEAYSCFRGMQSALEYAEAFKLVRSINYVS
ncbi:MAG: PIG-L family deacetylase [Prochlorococcus marinus CUG1438]|nr:PIG-L family deacetylase [Prochlorococcus marinus CUG1438]